MPVEETVIVDDVSAVDHSFETGYDEVKSTDDPAQIVVGPEAEMVGAVAGVFTVTVVVAVD